MLLNPKISVIVPVYNVEKYLSKCLDSILAQDFDDFEIIAVDDGSTDSSGNIVDDYSTRYPERIRAIHQENAGLGGARNTGIENAKGEYIAFIDSDDTILPEFLSSLYGEIEKTGAEIAVCNLIDTYTDGRFGKVQGVNNMEINRLISARDNDNVFTVTPSACNKLFKLSLFIDNNIRFPSRVWYEDLRTTYKLFPFATGLAFTHKPLYQYYLREGSIMRNPNIERNREIIDAIEDLISFYKANDLYDMFYKELEFLATQHVFWETSVRILKITKKHKLLSELKEYTFSNFPNALNNEKFKKFVSNNGIKGKIIYFCLRYNLHQLLYFMLKVNDATK